MPRPAARPDPSSGSRQAKHQPGPRPRAAIGTAEAPAEGGHCRPEPPPDAAGTEELTVDIELLEIVERQPPFPTPPARRAPVSLSDYLNRRAH